MSKTFAYIRQFFIYLFFCIAIFGMAIAQEIHPHKEVLDNGLTVLVTPMPSSSMVSAQVWVKTGSATEGEFLGSGVSHFLEHMLFKPTDVHPGGADEKVKELGGSINAATGYDYTYYYIRAPKETMDEIVGILADMIKGAKLVPEEIEKEREVIINEMRLIKDRPNWQLNEEMYRQMYLDHPYRHPIIGYEPTFRNISQNELIRYFQQKYIPNNMVVSISGGIVVDEATASVKHYFEDLVRGHEILRQLPQEKSPVAVRHVIKEYPTDLKRMVLAYPSVPIRHQDMYALDVLAMLLGQGKSSRLYQNIFKTKKLVNSINAHNRTPMDQGVFMVQALYDHEDKQAIIDAVYKEIEAIQTKGPSEKELKKARKQVLTENIFARQNPHGVAMRAALEEIFLGDPQFSDKYLEAVRKVTRDDIQRVASHYLKQDIVAIVELVPEQEDELIDTVSLQEKGIERYILTNGIILLLKQDKSLPIVAMNVMFRGGSQEVSDDLLGLSALMSGLWGKGVKGKDAKKIAQELDEQSVHISQNVRGAYLNIYAQSLAEDFDFTLRYVRDFLLFPTFPEKELAQQKQQQKIAIKAREESIVAMGFKHLNEELFKGHPSGRDTLGTHESIDRVTQHNLMAQYKKFLTANNMVISIVGDIDVDQTKQAVEDYLSPLPGKPVGVSLFKQTALTETIEKEYPWKKEQALVLFGAQGPTMYDEDKYPLQILSSIMGSSLNGRLFKRIREDLGKAYTLRVAASAGIDAGSVQALVLTDKQSIEEVKEVIIREFEKIKEELVSDDELKDSKTQLISRMEMSLDTIAPLSGQIANDEILGLGFDNYTKYEDRIHAVTKEDIQRVAQKYFTFDRGMWVIMRPTDPKIGQNP